MLTGPEATALALVDEAATVQILRDLVRVPSVGGSAAESEIQAQLALERERLIAEREAARVRVVGRGVGQ